MFKIIYAKSVFKDLKKIAPEQLSCIKEGIEELEKFPNISQLKQLKNHSLAEYRLRIGNYPRRICCLNSKRIWRAWSSSGCFSVNRIACMD
jgi:mRNA interferase RelE/StbE